MIHVVDVSTRRTHSALLEQMFRQRKASFLDRRNWRVSVEGDLEKDRFDDLDPLYVINADDDGRVLGSLRLLPTTGPHMLADVFPEVMGGAPILRHPSIWESSRFNVDTRAGGGFGDRQVNRATGELLAGLFELAERIGLERIVSVYDVAVHRVLKRAGCVITPIGETIHPDGLPTVAGSFAVGPEVSAELRRRAGLAGSPLAPGGPASVKHVA